MLSYELEMIFLGTLFPLLRAKLIKKERLNYKLHLLSLVKVQFSTLSFDHFNSVL